ncbi:MAG: protein kinase [Verrucomicrobiales bacterium]
MNPPQICDYILNELIGEGSTGFVWTASHQEQEGFAVKTFKGLSINRQLLSDSLVRIYNGPQHPGIARICDFDMAGPQAYVTTELFAENVPLANGQSALRTNNLEPLCGTVESQKGWAIAMLIADAMAFLHRNRIRHCNLKPSNVLFDNSTSPRPQLVDFTQGMLGGIEQIEQGDSLFYASPEQLRNPDHFFEGSAESWDVYSFGATIYRLVTGHFPRLNNDIVAFLRGSKTELNIRSQINPTHLAAAIEQEDAISWDTPPKSRLESNYRKVIGKCLKLNPKERYVDMREVLETFRSCKVKSSHAAAVTRLENKVKKLSSKTRNSRRRSLILATGIAAALAIAAFDVYTRLQPDPIKDPAPLPDPARVAETGSDRKLPENIPAQKGEEKTRQLQRTESQLAKITDDFEHSQATLNAVFGMISARDGDGRALYLIPDGTLGTVLNYYDEFARRHAGNLEMRASVATALNNGGELSLLLGDFPAAIEKLERAATLLENVETGGGDAGDQLTRKARVHHNLSDAKTACGMPRAANTAARQANEIHQSLVKQNPQAPANSRALAASSLHLARKMQAIDQPREAMPHAAKASELIGKLESENLVNESDLALLAAAAFETGRIQRTLGNLEDAIKSQIEAIDRYLELAGARPELANYRFQLARAYGEAADLAALLAESAEAAEANSEASGILRELADTNPDMPACRFELAHRLRMNVQFLKASDSIQAALIEQKKAIVLLDDLCKKHPRNTVYSYELATMSGEQSDLLGKINDYKQAVEMGKQAVDRMQALLTGDLDIESNNTKRPKYRRALAGLYAKLGYHSQNAGDIPEARHCIEKAQRHYQGLLAIDATDTYAIEGDKWAKASLKLLLVPENPPEEKKD